MLGLVTIVSILIYLGFVSVASESEITVLVAFGLTVAAYVICRPGSDLNHRHRILTQEDFVFNGIPLSQILDRRMFDLIKLAPHETILAKLTSLFPPPDFLVLLGDFSDPIMLANLREIHRSPRICQIPIIGVVAGECGIDLDIRDLRSHGFVGLISEKADRELVTQFANLAIGSLRSKQPIERARCVIPVEVTNGRHRTSEYALNLSASGMRLTSVNRQQLNSDLHVSFRLPMISGESVRAYGRVVYQVPSRNSGGRYEVGVRFHMIDLQSQKIISREISRLASAPPRSFFTRA